MRLNLCQYQAAVKLGQFFTRQGWAMVGLGLFKMPAQYGGGVAVGNFQHGGVLVNRPYPLSDFFGGNGCASCNDGGYNGFHV